MARRVQERTQRLQMAGAAEGARCEHPHAAHRCIEDMLGALAVHAARSGEEGDGLLADQIPGVVLPARQVQPAGAK
jgi:hypothetical protein